MWDPGPVILTQHRSTCREKRGGHRSARIILHIPVCKHTHTSTCRTHHIRSIGTPVPQKSAVHQQCRGGGALALKVVPCSSRSLKVLKGCLGILLRLRVSKELNVLKAPTRLVGLKVLKGTPGARLSFSEYEYYFWSRQPLGDREVLLNQSRAFSCSAQGISYVLTLA